VDVKTLIVVGIIAAVLWLALVRRGGDGDGGDRWRRPPRVPRPPQGAAGQPRRRPERRQPAETGRDR